MNLSQIPKFTKYLVIALIATTTITSATPSLAKYQRRYHTTAHAWLDMERELGTTENDYRELDEIITKSIKRIEQLGKRKTPEKQTKQETIEILKAIDSVIKERGISKETSVILLNQAIKTKFDCDLISVIYYSIGECLQLPIRLVAAPKHMFIRWDPDNRHNPFDEKSPENRGDLNWETTSGGEVRDADYIKSLKIPRASIAKSFYLTDLSKRSILGTEFGNIALAWKKRGNLHKEEAYYRKALEFDVKDLAPYNNLALIVSQRGEVDSAINYYSKALEINPDYVSAIMNLGSIYAKEGKYNKAIKNFTKVIALAPDNHSGYLNRCQAYRKIGALKKARKDYKVYLKLAPKEGH